MEEKTKAILEKAKEAACVLGKAAEEGAEKAAKIAYKALESSKLSLSNFELKNDIEMLYKEIGKLVYLTHIGLDIDPEDIELKLSLIDEKLEKIESNEKRRNDIKA